MNSRLVLIAVAVVGAVALFGVGSSYYADSNVVDPDGPTRAEMIENLEFQLGHLRLAGVPSECVDRITSSGLTCIESCLPHFYMLGTELEPPSATTEMVCKPVFCECSDGSRTEF